MGIKDLQVGQALQQTLDVGEMTWFRLQVKKPGWYVLDTKGQSDPFCRLYGRDFQLVARNDDSGENRNCRILHHLRKGTYYVEVMLFPYRSRSFSLTATHLSLQSLPTGQSLAGKINEPGALKLYRVEVVTPGLYEFFSTGNTDVICALLDTSHDALTFAATDDDSGKGSNCSLMQYLNMGQYLFLVRGAYFSRKGPYQLQFRKVQEAQLQFHAVTFGEPMRERLKSSKHRERYHFRLGERARVSFLASFQRNTPQMILLDINGVMMPGASYSVRHKGRVRLFSQTLMPGEYYLELRSPGTPKSAYSLWAYKDRDVVLPANRARLIADGTPQGTADQPYWYALFKLTLDGQSHHVIEAQHKAMTACFLEDANGKRLVSSWVSKAEPGVCRIEGRGRHGTVWVRLMMRKRTGRTTGPGRRRPSAVMQTQESRPALLEWISLERPSTSTTRSARGRSLSRPASRDKRDETKVQKGQPASLGLPITNTRSAPQIRFYQFVPRPLPINQTKDVSVTGDSGGLRIDVKRPDLYWFSLRGPEHIHCKLSDMFQRFLKQTVIFPQGCNIAAYLLRGSYLLRYRQSKSRRSFAAEWRSYRSFPAILGEQKILIGPVQKGHRKRFQMRVKQDGFYRVVAQLISSVTLVTRLSLYQGSRRIARHGRKTYRILTYLSKGQYDVETHVSLGRGAYTLEQERLETQSLRKGQTLSGRLVGPEAKLYYLVTVAQAQSYQFETLGKTDTYCQLYDAGGKRLAHNDDSGASRNCRLTRALRPGKYLLEVSSLHGPGGAFRLGMKSVLVKPSQVLVVGRASQGQLRSRKDAHRYRFRIQRPGKYIIATRNPPGTRTDPKCYLYQGDRQRRYNDDSGPKFNCKIVENLQRGWYTLVIKLAWSTRTGPYFVAVRRWGQAFPGVASTTRSARRPVVRQQKPALLSRGGVILQPGQRTQAMVVRTRRVDVFPLRIPYTGRYRIQTDGHIDTKCYLDDHSGGVLGADDDSGDGANCRLQLRLPAGSYQIRILARPAGRMGPYGISVSSE